MDEPPGKWLEEKPRGLIWIPLRHGSMSRSELRIIGDADYRQDAGCDCECAGQRPANWNRLRESSPNYVHLAAEQAWRPTHPSLALANPGRKPALLSSRRTAAKTRLRAGIRIGMPRALNLFTYAPLFSAYFESLGVPPENLHYSHFSSPEKYQQAAGFSAIDPCFPCKIALAHVFRTSSALRKRAARCDFLSSFRRADIATQGLHGLERVSFRGGNARSGEGRVFAHC